MRWLKMTFAAAILATAVVAMAGETEGLSYRTFIDFAKQGKVKSVVISDFATDSIKAVIKKDGAEVTYSVKKPYGTGEDALLLDFLKEKKIPHEIMNTDIHSSRSMWGAMLPAMIMFALPGLFILLIVVMAIIILSKVSHVERMLESETRRSGPS